MENPENENTKKVSYWKIFTAIGIFIIIAIGSSILITSCNSNERFTALETAIKNDSTRFVKIEKAIIDYQSETDKEISLLKKNDQSIIADQEAMKKDYLKMSERQDGLAKRQESTESQLKKQYLAHQNLRKEVQSNSEILKSYYANRSKEDSIAKAFVLKNGNYQVKGNAEFTPLQGEKETIISKDSTSTLSKNESKKPLPRRRRRDGNEQ